MLVFLSRDQLGHIGERLDTLPTCGTELEHCFACFFQDIPLAVVEEVRPYLPTRIFVKENNQWRPASQVSCFFQAGISTSHQHTRVYIYREGSVVPMIMV